MRELVRDAVVYGSWLAMGFAIFGLTVYVYNQAMGANVLEMNGYEFLFGCLIAVLVGEGLLMTTCENHFLAFLGMAGTTAVPLIIGTGILNIFYPLGADSVIFVVMGVVVLILSTIAGALEL